MDVQPKKRRPKLVFAALNTIRSKDKPSHNPFEPQLQSSLSSQVSKWTPFRKASKPRKPLGDVFHSQRGKSGLQIKAQKLSKPEKFEIFNQEAAQKREEQKQEKSFQDEKATVQQSIDVGIHKSVKAAGLKNKRKLGSDAVSGTLKSILKRRRFRGGKRRSGRMPQRRHTESSVEKSIKFGAEVIVRRYSQDLPATNYGKEIQLALNEEKKVRVSELAPVYSHFMTEDDTELKFNDADNDSASDSEQFSPSVKPLTIFPSPSFKPAMGNERLASPCVLPEPPSIPPLADHELPDSVEQVEQMCAPITEPCSPVQREVSRDDQDRTLTAPEIKAAVSPTSSVNSSDTEIVESDDEDPASARLVARSPILESFAQVHSGIPASKTCTPLPRIEAEPVDVRHRLSFGSCNLSPSVVSMRHESSNGLPESVHSDTPSERRSHDKQNVSDVVRRQVTPHVKAKPMTQRRGQRLQIGALDGGPITCSLQSCLNLTYCQTFAGFASKDDVGPVADPQCLLEPVCSLQRLRLDDEKEG